MFEKRPSIASIGTSNIWKIFIKIPQIVDFGTAQGLSILIQNYVILDTSFYKYTSLELGKRAEEAINGLCTGEVMFFIILLWHFVYFLFHRKQGDTRPTKRW